MGYQGIAGGTLRHQMEIDIQALNVDFDVTDNLTLSSYTQQRYGAIGGQDQDGSMTRHAWAGRFSEDEKGLNLSPLPKGKVAPFRWVV